MTPEEEAYAIAERRIAEAKASGAHVLNLTVNDVKVGGDYFLRDPKLNDLARVPPALADLADLTSLHLTGTQVANLAPLAGLTTLQTLHLTGTQVADLAPLAGLTTLQTLHLTGTQVADFAPLAGLTGLQTLVLDGAPVWDIFPLASLTDLRNLVLAGAAVTDLTPLGKLFALRLLDLEQTQVSDLTPLTDLSLLQKLHLGSTEVTDLAPLGSLSELRLLVLDRTQVSDLSPLKDVRALEEGARENGGLFFSDCPNITDPVLRELAEKDNPERTVETLAYLRGKGAEAPEEQFDPGSFSQTGPGPRFEPKGRYLEMEISPDEIGAMAEPLKPQVRELFSELSSVIGSSNQLGDLKDRADRMRALAEKSTGDLRGDAAELWTLSVYFADYQQQDDAAQVRPDGFVEALEPDIRRALNSASAVGAVFARQFPDARALDEELGRFQRIEIPAEVAEALFEAAQKAGVIRPSTAEPLILMAQTGAGSGSQAGKAHDGSLLTARNLAIAAALATMIGYPVAQISGPILSKTGEAIEAEFDLSNNSAKLLREQYEAIKELFRGQPAERAFEQLSKMAPPAPKPASPQSSPKPKPKPKH